MPRENQFDSAYGAIDRILADYGGQPLMQDLLDSKDPRLAAILHLLTRSLRTREVGEKIGLSMMAEHVGARSNEEMVSILSLPLEAGLLELKKDYVVITKRGRAFLEKLMEIEQLVQRDIPDPVATLEKAVEAYSRPDGVPRITILTNFGFWPRGTVRVRAFPIAKGLAASGYKVIMLVPPWDNPQESGRWYVRDNVIIGNVRVSRFLLISYLVVPIVLARWARRTGADLVHCFKPIAYSGLASAYLRTISPKPLVVDVDDLEGSDGWAGRNQRSFVLRQLFDSLQTRLPGQAHAVTVASHVLERYLLDHGVAPDRLFYVPNCPSLPLPGVVEPAETPTIAFGGFIPQWIEGANDLDLLISAVEILAADFPSVRCIAMGSGPGLEGFRNAVTTRGLSGYIEVDGFVGPTAGAMCLAQANVLLYPSLGDRIDDNQGQARLADYMSLEKPIVVPRMEGIRDYIPDEEFGLFYTPGDARDFARAISRLLSNPDLGRRLARNAKSKVEEDFSWDKWIQEVEKAYATAMSQYVGQKERPMATTELMPGVEVEPYPTARRVGWTLLIVIFFLALAVLFAILLTATGALPLLAPLMGTYVLVALGFLALEILVAIILGKV